MDYWPISSSITSLTVDILFILYALLPQKINPLSKSPLTALISADVMQYGVLAGLHGIKQS